MTIPFKRLGGLGLALSLGLMASSPIMAEPSAVAPSSAIAASTAASPSATETSSAMVSSAMASSSVSATPAPAPVAAAPAQAPTVLASQVVLTDKTLDKANTTYLILCTALVLMMTLPGLALFYGGMVRRKNIVATVTQSVSVTCVVAIVWWVLGYSLSFGTNPSAAGFLGYGGDFINKYIGGFDTILLRNVNSGTAYSAAPGVPEFTWISYQLTFAIITPALITGAFAERVKLSGLMLFMTLWSIFVYAPICHMVWGGGMLAKAGVIDFAGGSVVHVNAGVIFIMVGAALLFVGWIGFNAGSEWAGDAIASAALLNTLLATCTAGMTWKIVEWVFRGKPSLVGILSGLVAGLVAITPACGFVDPTGAMFIGAVAGPVCYISATFIKKLLGYDDSLDAFGIHGAGGFLGAVLTGVFAKEAINPLSKGASVMTQLYGLGVTVLWSAVGTFLILIICKFTTGLRVTAEEEEAGLDLALHDEVLEH